MAAYFLHARHCCQWLLKYDNQWQNKGLCLHGGHISIGEPDDKYRCSGSQIPLHDSLPELLSKTESEK